VAFLLFRQEMRLCDLGCHAVIDSMTCRLSGALLEGIELGLDGVAKRRGVTHMFEPQYDTPSPENAERAIRAIGGFFDDHTLDLCQRHICRLSPQFHPLGCDHPPVGEPDLELFPFEIGPDIGPYCRAPKPHADLPEMKKERDRREEEPGAHTGPHHDAILLRDGE
jgi:hypothetical protein